MVAEAREEEVQILLEEGAGLYEAGKLFEALAAWKAALNIDPENEIATEYLRFIEESFGIGVDALLAHEEPAGPPPIEVEEAAAPVRVVVAGRAHRPDESMEELDWSEILEDGPGEAPSAVSTIAAADEEFFVALESPQLGVAEAWGAAESPAGVPQVDEAPAPAHDPFMMPASRFAETVAAEPSVAGPTDPFGAVGEGVVDTWGDAPQEMTDDSIDQMLERDFEAWEEATGRRNVPLPTDPFALVQEPELDDEPLDQQPPVVAPPLEDDWTGLPPPLSAPWPVPSAPKAPPRPPAPPARVEVASEPPLAFQPTRPFGHRSVEEDSVQVPIPDLGGEPSAPPMALSPVEPPPPAIEDHEASVEFGGPDGPFADLFGDSFADKEAPELGALLEDDFGMEEVGEQSSTDFLPDLVQAPPTFEPFDLGDLEEPPPSGRRAPTPAAWSPAPAAARPEPRSAPVPQARPEPRSAPVPQARPEPRSAPPAVIPAVPTPAVATPVVAPVVPAPQAQAAPPARPTPVVPAPAVPARAVPAPVVRAPAEPVPSAPPVPIRTTAVGIPAPPVRTPAPVSTPPRPVPAAAPTPAAADEFAGAGAVLRRTRRRPISPSTPAAPVAAPAAPVRAAEAPPRPISSSLEALLRNGLSDLDRIEARATTPIRQLVPSPPPPGTDLDELMEQASRKQRAGDFSGSLELVEQILAGNPNHAKARGYLEANTSRLLEMYRARLGPLTRMPRVKLRPDEIIWQTLDHRAGFLLSQVDGRTTFEDIIEISGMSELDATRTLARLVEFGIIG